MDNTQAKARNLDRAERARALIDTRLICCRDDLEDWIVDRVADLAHLANAEGLNALRLLERAERHFTIERHEQYAEADEDAEPPSIVATGGDTGHGEVVRGDVLLIHYEEAEANEDYCRDVFFQARQAGAPPVVLDSLREIMNDCHSQEAKGKL